MHVRQHLHAVEWMHPAICGQGISIISRHAGGPCKAANCIRCYLPIWHTRAHVTVQQMVTVRCLHYGEAAM